MAASPPIVDLPRALVDRYDVPGPRYTSYPSVLHWQTPIDGSSYRDVLRTVGGDEEPLALYVHLPFCASRCTYCGCNATVTQRPEVVSAYLDRLDRELAMIEAELGHGRRVQQMHWGGGTPNFLSEPQLVRAFAMLATRFAFAAGAELSIEADPRLVTRSQLRWLRGLGFSRLSYGVQDLDADVQQAIGRVQPESVVRAACDLAREEGFTELNIDLIYGLPRQTPASFARTIGTVLGLQPERVACFGYAHVPWQRPHQKRIEERSLPSSHTRLDLFRVAVERFTSAGYAWLGLDHFARPDDPLAVAAQERRLHRNFMGYTTMPATHLLGVGVSAIGDLGGHYVQNSARLGAWQRSIDANELPVMRAHRLSADDVARRAAIHHLMCNLELPVDLLPDDAQALEATFARFVDDGLMERDAAGWQVTPFGRLFLRNLAMPLDAYLGRDATRGGAPAEAPEDDAEAVAGLVTVAPRYSRTV
ncbi:MAG: oxygen-independent coproporphyrinogen III oxidase [Gemmatimonadaceae bacterium]|nr:oxygen-independent coproporphyrinogen III oxidase [Gemmatimonadaceae bacterium]